MLKVLADSPRPESKITISFLFLSNRGRGILDRLIFTYNKLGRRDQCPGLPIGVNETWIEFRDWKNRVMILVERRPGAKT